MPLNPKGLIARGPPPQPSWHLYLRLALILVSIVVMGISGWAIDLLNNPSFGGLLRRQSLDELLDGLLGDSSSSGSITTAPSSNPSKYHGDSAPIFMLFMAIYTLISTATITAFEQYLPRYTFRIGPLITYILNVILLLCAWALAANDAAAIAPWGASGSPKWYKNMYGAYGATAGLGALLWVLVIVNTVFFGLACLQHPEGVRPDHNEQLGTPMQSTSPAKVEAGYGQPQVQDHQATYHP